MAKKVKKTRLEFKARVSTTSLTSAEYERSMDLLARLIAQAYAADNPNLFRQNQSDNTQIDTEEVLQKKVNSKTQVA